MLANLSLLILAIAVSLDGFGVGVMYGLRKIKIPLLSIVIICVCSGIVIILSMQLGVWLSQLFPAIVAQWIGAAILIGIGIWAIVQMIRQKNEEHSSGTTGASFRRSGGKQPLQQESVQSWKKDHLHNTVTLAERPPVRNVATIEIKRLGIVIQILQSPAIADMDRSGNISWKEAALLGTALSLDAFGAGIGAAFMGFTPWITAIAIALASGVFLTSGLRIGFRFAELQWIRKVSYLPGVILIVIGFLKLL